MSDAFDTIMRGYCDAQLRFLRMRETCRAIPANDEVKIMSNKALTKTTPDNVDGFTGYSDRVEGDDGAPTDRIIQGTLLKFNNQAQWVSRDDAEMSADLELVAIDVLRIAQRWKDQMPVETRVLAPDEPFPDMVALNESAPRSEWHEDLNGKMVGPWQAQRIVYLLDPKTMTKYTYPTATVGGSICIRELTDRVRWMRKFRGPGIYAVVTLNHTHMNTRFGGRERPDLRIMRWVQFGDGGKVLPAPAGGPVPSSGGVTAPAETSPATLHHAAPLAPGRQPLADKEVVEPSLGEQMDDGLPF